MRLKVSLFVFFSMLFLTAVFGNNGKDNTGNTMFESFDVFYQNNRGVKIELKSLNEIDILPQGTMLYYHRKSNDDIIYTNERRVALFTPGKNFRKNIKQNFQKNSTGIIWKTAEINQRVGTVIDAVYENSSSYDPIWDSILVDAEHENILARTNGEYTYPQAKQYPTYDCGPWKWPSTLIDSMEVYSFYFDSFSFDNKDDAIGYTLMQTIENGMNEQTPIMVFYSELTSENPDAYTKSHGISHQGFDEDGNFLPAESMNYFSLVQDSKTLPEGYDPGQFIGLKFAISVIDEEDGTTHKRFGRDLFGTFETEGINYYYTGPGAYIGTELMEPLNEPLNISADPVTAIISWDAPEGDVTGYTIYRGPTKVAENINDTEYQLSNLIPIRPYNIKVCSEYATGNSLTTPVSFDYTPAVEYPTPKNAYVDETTYLLTWDKPEFETWISYNDDKLNYTIGAGQALDSEAAIRFYPSQTSRYDGYSIHSIKFAPYEHNCEYSIRIWDDEGGNNLVYEQIITENLNYEEWNEITLDSPYQIDGSKNLWIGIRANTESGYPFYYDKSNCIAPGRADLLRVVGASEWDILYNEEYQYNINWCISALIDVNGNEEQSAVTDYTISLDDNILSNNTSGFEYLLTDNLTVNTQYTAGVSANYSGGTSESITVDFIYDPVGIEENILNSNYLSQNSPNPFSNTTNINYNIEEGYNGIVNISVYNVFGQRIKELVNSTHKEGNYNVKFDASSLEKGIYLYTLKAGELSFSKMMMIIE